MIKATLLWLAIKFLWLGDCMKFLTPGPRSSYLVSCYSLLALRVIGYQSSVNSCVVFLSYVTEWIVKSFLLRFKVQ